MKLPERREKVIEKMENISLIKLHFLYLKEMCLICMEKSAITSGTTQY